MWESEAKGELLISVGCWVLERRQDLFSSDCRPRPSQKGCLYTAHHITHAQTHTHALAAKIRGDIFIFCNDTLLTRCVIVHALVYTAGRTWSLTWKECPRLSANEEWLHVNGVALTTHHGYTRLITPGSFKSATSASASRAHLSNTQNPECHFEGETLSVSCHTLKSSSRLCASCRKYWWNAQKFCGKHYQVCKVISSSLYSKLWKAG